MKKNLLQCEICRGVFEVSKGFFNGKDDPIFCTFCGKDKLTIEQENDYTQGINLTSEQRAFLKTFLLMTTRYREGELKASIALSKELDENGNIKFPNMAANADWWKEAISIIQEIQDII